MAIVKIIGFETGDNSQSGTVVGTSSIQSTIKRTGTYAGKVNPTTSGTGYLAVSLSPATQFALRFYFYAASIPSAAEHCFVSFFDTAFLELFLNSNGTLEAKRSGASKGVSAAISAGTWYRIDVKGVSGAQAVSLNGTEFATDTQAYTSVSLGLGKYANTNSASVDFYYDDILVNDAASAYPLGAGQSIARQPGAGLGTPTYNAWTKSTGTDAGALWDNSPFTTGDFCSTATQNAQTSFVSPFSAGTNAIGASDTINACQVGLVAKTSATSSNGTNLYIRRRVNSADTDSLLILGTSDAYYQESTFWTATRAQLDAMQAGAVTTLATRVRTVEDVWVFCDYTPAAADVSVNLTGQAATAAQGILSPAGGSITATIVSSAQATSARGSHTVVHTQALTGQGLASAQGTLTPATGAAGTSVNLTGQQATVSQGILSPPPVSSREYILAPGVYLSDRNTYSYILAGVYVTGTGAGATAVTTATLTGLGLTVAQGSFAALHSQALTGLQLTASGGTLTASHVNTAALTGLQVTASGGILSASFTQTAALTGLQATTAQGTLAISHSNALTGRGATAEQGDLISGAGGQASLTGLGATTAQGSLGTPLHSNALTGQAATTAQGSLATQHSDALTGLEATVGRGDVGTAAGGSATLAGLAVSVSRGAFQVNISVPIEIGDEHALSGLQANTAQGTPATLHSNTLTGQAATASVGIVTAVHTNTGTITGQQLSASGGLVGTQHSNALTGQQATAQQGNASAGSAGISTLAGLTATASQGALRPDHLNAITGLQAATAAGTVTAARSYAVALVGRELTASQGELGVLHSNVLDGQAATGQQGALTAARTSQALAGQQATATGGNVGTQHSQALDGQQATASQGQLTAGAVAASPVAGLQATASAGSLGTLHSNTLTGQAATAQRGTVSGVVAGGTAMTGLQATAQQGQLSASWSISVVLSGQQATATDGDVGTQHSQALIGRQATVQRGAVSVSIPGEDTLAGQQATASVGVLFPELQVPIEELPGVELAGLECVVEQGTMTPIGGTIVLFPGAGGKYCNHDDDGRVSGNSKGRRLCHDNEDTRLKVNER